jgi:hypothetical protein
MKCMNDHENERSAGCKTTIAEMKTRLREAHEACADDVIRLCGKETFGGGRIIHCLKEQATELTLPSQIQTCNEAGTDSKKQVLEEREYRACHGHSMRSSFISRLLSLI